MNVWEWGLFFVTGVLALQILVSLMSYYHQFYRQEFLNEHLRNQQHTASTAGGIKEANAASLPPARQENGTTPPSAAGERQARRNAA